jgi:hypothetical protein
LRRKEERSKAVRVKGSVALRDLGGLETISTQKCALVDLAVRTKLLVESVDVFVLAIGSPVNRLKRRPCHVTASVAIMRARVAADLSPRDISSGENGDLRYFVVQFTHDGLDALAVREVFVREWRFLRSHPCL